MSKKTEHRIEHQDLAKRPDAIALPLIDQAGVAEAYRIAAERLDSSPAHIIRNN